MFSNFGVPEEEWMKGVEMNWLKVLAESSALPDITSLGTAGLMGAMWLWERRTSRQREEQLDEAHARIIGDRVLLDQLIDVVKQNTDAMSRLCATQDQLMRRIDISNDKAAEGSGT
jgi:hypothetical protein